jgi:hypothetical protein
MIDGNNIERDVAITRTNYRYFHCFPFYNKELILVMCRKSVLIDAFVLDEIIRIMIKVAINP